MMVTGTVAPILIKIWQNREVMQKAFLESHIRRRVAGLPNVTINYEVSVQDLLTSDDKSKISGVAFTQSEEQATMHADLVVDTTGRASRTPQWLTELGYDVPKETSFETGLRYASRMYQPKKEQDWQVMILYPKMPESKKLGVICGVEEDRWLVTLVGYLGDHPPTDEEGYLDYARQLASPEIYHLLQEAEPLSDITTFTYPRQRRRHYDKLKRFPDGLVVMADAACSFDPVFGQGMTVAALQAVELDKLHVRTGGNMAGFPRKFHKRIAAVTNLPWMLATGETRRFPELSNPKPVWLKLMHWYNGLIYSASGSDPAVYECFLKVLHLTTGPHQLIHPKILWRVARHSLSQRFRKARTSTQPSVVDTRAPARNMMN